MQNTMPLDTTLVRQVRLYVPCETLSTLHVSLLYWQNDV